MKNKKKVLIGGILAVIIFGAGLFGGKVFGNSSWSTTVINSANATLAKTGSEKAKELAANTNLSREMQALFQSEIEAQQRELEQLLEEYYRMRLEGLADTSEYKEVGDRIEAIKRTLVNRYKSEIDAIFE